MKKILLLFFFVSTAFAGKGQNLVPNGDFEQYSSCPNSTSQVYKAIPWTNPAIGTPDYFNQCAPMGSVDVPDNGYGFQYANSGNGYCGIIAGRNEPNFNNWREYLEVPLNSTLTANTCYYFEMYISLANKSRYTSDAMGVYFSDTLINGINNWQSLPYTPQLNFNLGLNPDTVSWIHISGNYTASGGEAFIIIGNFKDSSQTNIQLTNPAGLWDWSYFYIDDVVLTPCTGIQEQNNNEAITIYPNPVKDELKVSGLKFKVGDQIKIYDIMGKEILKSLILNPKSSINLQSLKSGIYFIEINNGKEIFRKKFIKQ